MIEGRQEERERSHGYARTGGALTAEEREISRRMQSHGGRRVQTLCSGKDSDTGTRLQEEGERATDLPDADDGICYEDEQDDKRFHEGGD